MHHANVSDNVHNITEHTAAANTGGHSAMTHSILCYEVDIITKAKQLLINF